LADRSPVACASQCAPPAYDCVDNWSRVSVGGASTLAAAVVTAPCTLSSSSCAGGASSCTICVADCRPCIPVCDDVRPCAATRVPDAMSPSIDTTYGPCCTPPDGDHARSPGVPLP